MTFSNNIMKPAKMKDYIEKIHFDKKEENLDFLRFLKKNLEIKQI